jgi:hypothetical protein
MATTSALDSCATPFSKVVGLAHFYPVAAVNGMTAVIQPKNEREYPAGPKESEV